MSSTPAPALTLALSTTRIRAARDSVDLTWTATNAASCVASGAWTGSRPLAGTVVVKPGTAGNFSYALQCSGAGGDVSRDVALSVAPPASRRRIGP